MKKGKHQIPMDGVNEYDAFTRWRKLLCSFHNRTGLVKKSQRTYWKRDRRIAKESLVNGEA